MELSLRVKPKTSKERIGYTPEGELVVWLKAPAVEGKANRALERYLAEFVGMAPSCVRVVGGMHSRLKKVVLEGISEQAWQNCLQLAGVFKQKED